MKNEDILYYALRDYVHNQMLEISKGRKTLKRLSPKPMPWYEDLLNDTADAWRLWMKVNRLDVMLEVNRLPRRCDL